MTLDLLFPAFPPALDGIGDYTAHLARTLAPAHDVRVLTAQPDAASIPGVAVCRAFSTDRRRSVHNLVDLVAERAPDWLLLQYNPFSYGRWGLNLSLPAAIRRIRAASPHTRLALTVHEPFVPVESAAFAVMTTWQRAQFWQLGRMADVAFFAIEPWSQRFAGWFPQTRVVTLPVGSNMPCLPGCRDAIRAELDMPEDALVVGLFGRGHPSRLLPFIRRSVLRLRANGQDARVLYVGPADALVRRELSDVPLTAPGALPGPDVSRHFQAMDLFLAPFRKGVSARRGSFLVGLQHGVPTVTTVGAQTDTLFLDHADRAFLLAPDDAPAAYAARVEEAATDPALRRRIGAGGRALFDDVFAWPRIADAMLRALAPDDAPDPANPAPTAAPRPSLHPSLDG